MQIISTPYGGALRPCVGVWGKCVIHAEDPSYSFIHGSVYVPFKNNRAWGIYDQKGKLIEESVDLHGPTGQFLGQSQPLDLQIDDQLPVAPHVHYVYGGVISLHYGHFIVNTLSRLWNCVRGGRRELKVIFHGPGTIEDWFARPFINAIFNSLGLQRDDIVSFSEPTLIPGLLIPWPSIQEQHYAHQVFGDLCAHIGVGLIGDKTPAVLNNPIYLSKTKMASGVGRVVNEIIVEEFLRAEGFDVAYPETLTIQEQLQIFAERTCIVSITGSALHTGVFQPPRGRVIGVSPTGSPNSNFLLLDQVAGYCVDYLFPEGTTVVGQGTDGFLTSLEFRDPILIAKGLVHYITTMTYNSTAIE